MLVFFTNFKSLEFQVRYLALFLFLVIDDFELFWMESLQKNIQLMREFLKVPFLVPHFSYYTLMIFLTMFFVILLSMLIILLCILTVIGHLICGNNFCHRSNVKTQVKCKKIYFFNFQFAEAKFLHNCFWCNLIVYNSI